MVSERITIITAVQVNHIFMDCLFKEGEDTEHHILTEGIIHTVGFQPERLEQHRQEIHDMLAELPDEFKVATGGGYSFLNACLDRYGNQWADEHRTVEQLVLLGLAIGEVEYLLPRPMWGMMPGGVPYFVVRQ